MNIMSYFVINPLIVTAVAVAVAGHAGCRPAIDTGRNADPSRWPQSDDATDPANSAPNEGLRTPGSPCFASKSPQLPSELKQLCENVIKPQQELTQLYTELCIQGHLVGLLKSPRCGWDGNPGHIRSFMHHYFMQKDTSKDYEDINSSITHAPVTLDKYLRPVQLAFENYEQFRSEGYQWVAGTREHRNLSGTTWVEGINYRFRADKVEYEVGYQGRMQLYKLTPDLYVHINYATGDFARITHFAQIMLYSRQSDQSTLALKLEHRRVASQGLYDLAKRSAAEMARDVMEKGYKNAIKPL
jgi:hypothetical protein